MSDHDPPLDVAKSSSPSSTLDTSSVNYAFLVHSQKTLTQDLPPRVENKLLGRQKRRRTSPEDHAILEAEYQKNPKPDRTARTNIVSRVALGDKEVQIWFQNRRQNDRRKSKPLQPYELVAPRNMIHTSNVKPPGGPGSSSRNDLFDRLPQFLNDKTPAMGSSQETCIDSSFESNALPRSHDEIDNQMPSSQTSVDSKLTTRTDAGDGELNTPPQEGLKLSTDLDSHRFSNKRKRDLGDHGLEEDGANQSANADFVPPSLRISLSFDGEAMVRTEEEKTPSPPKDRKSALRISMSSDGEALIRAGNEASPSPSRDRAALMNKRRGHFEGLRRSSSAIGLNSLSSPSADLRGAKNKSFGRSRDSRTWELYCDTDARSALSASSPANTQNGKVVSLSRSSSNRSVGRKSLPGGRNTLAPRPDLANALGTPKESTGKRKLSRAVSSLARLQSDQNLPMKTVPMKNGKDAKGGKPTDDDIDFQLGDSDKENWLPGTQTTNIRRRAPHGHRRRPALQDSQSAAGKSENNRISTTSSKRLKGSRGRHLENKENSGAVSEDDEISAFMASGSSGPSQEEDLDCIQGLLSLSQGAWR